MFDVCKELGSVGIPALVLADGSVTLDWESWMQAQGLPIVCRESAQACSIDGKGC